jgi:hypothetical protein
MDDSGPWALLPWRTKSFNTPWERSDRRDVWVEPLDYERAVVVDAAQRKTKENERENSFK